MRVTLTGASGLIGTALGESLRADGHEVIRLVRRKPTAADELRWDPHRGTVDPAAVDGVDAVVHLAGVGIGDRRWTDDHKQKVLTSRTGGTTAISEAIANAPNRPPVLISASAVGWYGDTGAREVDESEPAGNDFLAQLCQAWEDATAPAAAAGTRVARVRSGLVLSRSGGMMSRIRPLFALGLGGKLGSGGQYWPWVSLPDEVAAIRYLIEHEVSGPVNATGPDPVTNAEFTRTLGRLLGRPTLLSVPGFALRLALGEFAQVGVLGGQRAMPRVLTDAGFTFTHRSVEDALRWATTRG